jgi:hypothetical protein
MEAARNDFANLAADLGINKVLEKMAKSFGEGVAHRTGQAYGEGVGADLLKGQLGITVGTGILRSGGTKPNPPHTNHGTYPGTPAT